MKGPASLNDFWPISFMGWFHKLMVCVLTTRLCLVIGQLINHSQTTFTQGWSIFDKWIIVQEVLDVMKRNKEGLIFKLDLKKAYDCMN